MALKERKFYPKFKGRIQNGVLRHENKQAFERYLLTMDGKEIETVVKPRAKERSRQEEKFYHAVVVRMVADEMTIMDEEAHQFLKSMFLRREEQTLQGFRYERTLSTTELSDKAYREFWESCIRWAALPTQDEGLGIESGLGLFIPYPNEVDFTYY
jgi:hypothetical protein